MTSVNTNASATTALRTLQQTNKALDTTQNRISTGLKIGEAKDNAAYWAISTTLKSDNKSLSTVKDALGLGAATVDTAYQGLNKAKEVLDQIKSKLTSATQDGLDRNVIQDEIKALQDQLKSISTSSIFSGENWLSVDSSVAGYNANKEIVASFSRDAKGAVSIGTVAVDTTTVKLFDASASANGILDGAKALKAADGTALTVGGTDASGAAPALQSLNATTATAGVTGAGATAATGAFGTIDLTNLHANDRITFNIALNGAVATPVTVATGSPAIAANTDFATAVNAGLTAAGVTGVTASVGTGANAGKLVLTSTATGAGATIVISNVAALDGDGAAITQATATAGLSGVTPLGNGTSTKATGVLAFGAAAAAAAAGQERLIEMNFQYKNEVYLVRLNEAAIAGITDAATMATALDTALHAATRVGDGVAFSTAHPNSATVGFTVGIDPTAPTGNDVVVRSNSSGADEKIGFSNINSYAVTTATGLRSAATAGASGIFTATTPYAAGTDTAAVLTSTFGLGTVAAGDRITFDATLSTGALPADQTTRSVSIQTNTGWTAATFATSVQQAVDTAFGAGKILVTNNAGTTTFTTVATGASVALAISNVLGVDGDGAAASTAGLTAGSATGTATATAAAASTKTDVAFSGSMTFDDQDTVTFDVAVDGGAAKKVTINKAIIGTALGTTDGVVSSAANYATVINSALTAAGVTGLTTTADGANRITIAKTATGAGSVAVSNAVASTGGDTISVDGINISDTALTSSGVTTAAQRKAVLSAYITVVNEAINSITTAAAKLGAVASRIELQNSFVDTLMDTIDKGVGNLIDADLSEESTRLQALQTKQQLGVQALSIANSGTQNILRLFQ